MLYTLTSGHFTCIQKKHIDVPYLICRRTHLHTSQIQPNLIAVAHTYPHTHTPTHTHTHTYPHTHAHTHLPTHTHAHTYPHTHTHTPTHTHTHLPTHTHTHTYPHTHTPTHTHPHAYLILYIAVAELQTEQIFVRLTQRLVEMKVRLLVLQPQQRGDALVDAVHRFLRDAAVTVTGGLIKQMRMSGLVINFICSEILYRG